MQSCTNWEGPIYPLKRDCWYKKYQLITTVDTIMTSKEINQKDKYFFGWPGLYTFLVSLKKIHTYEIKSHKAEIKYIDSLIASDLK